MYHKAGSTEHLKKVRAVIKSGGYATGKQNTSVKPPKADAPEELGHENTDSTQVPDAADMKKLKDGGCAGGGESATRLDKHKRGGKPKGKAHVNVNVIVPQGGKQGIPVPAGAAPMGGPSAPPIAPPQMPGSVGAGSPPPMGMKPPGMKKGGVAKYDAGAGSGEGRLEKISEYGQKAKK